MTDPAARPRRLLRALLLSMGVAALAAGAWAAWMGWDQEYYTDPSTGDPAGPYRTWQVVGCVSTLLVVAVVGFLVLEPALVAAASTLGFTTAYAVTVVPADESGLSVVGVVMVFVAMTVASGLLTLVAAGFRAWWARRRPDQRPPLPQSR